MIESAKCTLNFSPITCDDLERMKKNENENENVSESELLTRALHEFLDVNMNIPQSTIRKMTINKIWHNLELDFQKISAEFSNICPVNTIFKYVKNLEPEQKVSLFIPTVLEPQYEELNNIAYHLRNSEPRQKTVIKYLGCSLALYSRLPSEKNCCHVITQTTQPYSLAKTIIPLKRGRESNDSDDDDSKKTKKEKYQTTKAAADQKTNKEKSQTTKAATDQTVQPSFSGIPKPSFNPVPCYNKPKSSPCLTPGGGFWSTDDPRSPAPKQPLENSQDLTMGHY